MSWTWSAVGCALSLLVVFLLAWKWKIPALHTLVGGAGAALVMAVPFLWIHPRWGTGWWLAVGVLLQTGAALALALALLMIRFWRDPERIPPETEGVVLSAADGRVLYVRAVDAGDTPLVTKKGKDYLLSELTGTGAPRGAAWVISVEMTFVDVHVTRCPIAGRVALLKHIPGGFMSLRREEAPFSNERHTTVIEGGSLVVAVVQVASRLVRRVESYLTVGETVSAGQRLGIIRLGSLVAVVLPRREDVRVQVKAGDQVTAGVSVLARFGPDGGEQGVEA